MSDTSKAGLLPPIVIGQGRPKPAVAKAEPKTTKISAPDSKNKPSGAVSGIVFASKPKDGRGSSIYLQKATWAKVDAIKDKYGLSRSEVIETLLKKALT